MALVHSRSNGERGKLGLLAEKEGTAFDRAFHVSAKTRDHVNPL